MRHCEDCSSAVRNGWGQHTIDREPSKPTYTLKVRGGRERDSGGKKAGKGPLVQVERSATFRSQPGPISFLHKQEMRQRKRGENMDDFEVVLHDKLDDGCGIPAGGVGLQGCTDNCNEEGYIVRRLTPTECARLQGFPDDWCADVPHTDAQEYKMWGNGIALNCILPMMQNIVAVLSE